MPRLASPAAEKLGLLRWMTTGGNVGRQVREPLSGFQQFWVPSLSMTDTVL